MRLSISGEADGGIVLAKVELYPEGEKDPFDLGELKFTLDEWTEFVAHFAIKGDTLMPFDIRSTDGELVLL